MSKIFFALAVWIFCGLAAAGITNAHDRCNFSINNSPGRRAEDQSFGLVWGIVGGPIALITSLGVTGFAYHGWTLRRDIVQPGEC